MVTLMAHTVFFFFLSSFSGRLWSAELLNMYVYPSQITFISVKNWIWWYSDYIF